MVGDPLASILRSGRELFNAKFVQARRRYPNLDSQIFSAFLGSTLDPLARLLTSTGDELPLFVQSAYDVALELAGEGAINLEGGTHSLFSQAWLEIIPRVPASILGTGEAVLGAISNATQNLARAPGARPEEWIRGMAAIAPQCQSLPELLQVGQVLAWRAGLAQYRRGALELAGQLREPLVRAALRIQDGITTAAALARLAQDVWYDPSVSGAADAPRALRAVRRAGGFRGFGGNFLIPPTVAATDGQLFVSSGDDTWLLIADAFGQSLHRATAQEFAAAQAVSANPTEKVQVSSTKITVDQNSASLAVPGPVTSVAILPHTIAVTSALTHAVQLVAR